MVSQVVMPKRSGCLGLRCRGLASQCSLTTDAATLPLAHSAPYPELLTIGECELEAIVLDNAAATHFFGLTGGSTAFRKEEVGIDTEAVGEFLPGSVEHDVFSPNAHLVISWLTVAAVDYRAESSAPGSLFWPPLALEFMRDGGCSSTDMTIYM